MWFYSIQGKDRLVKRSNATYSTAKEAREAAVKYLRANKTKIVRSDHPDEKFFIATGRPDW